MTIIPENLRKRFEKEKRLYYASNYALYSEWLENMITNASKLSEPTGWDCPTSPTGQCDYSGDWEEESCIYCGQPEERK